MKREVIIIGNSENVMNYQFGNIIDSFDVVVRINDFKMGGFEREVGSKIDKMVLTKAMLWKMDQVDAKTMTFSAWADYITSNFPQVDQNDIEWLSWCPYKPPTGKVVTTGIHVIHHFIKEGCDIFTHGIGDGDSHYWDTNHTMCNKHDLTFERKSIGNIRKLENYFVDTLEIKTRNDFPKLLNTLNLNGSWIELGVAQGHFNNLLAKNNQEEVVWGIDRWSDHHDLNEYVNAVSLCNNSRLLRATFDEGLNQFADDYFDFIYIDGYAHTGQNSGKTLKDWYPKLKSGGVFAGHDYHEQWQPTIDMVDSFIKTKGLDLHLTVDDTFPSWWVIKP